jgi:putative transposase
MPVRKIPFVNGEYYHVLNRGVAQMAFFNEARNYKQFIKTMLYYQIENPKPRLSYFSPESNLLNADKKIVEIICYCLIPNHFHFLLKQLREKGVTEFISKLSNSYTKYFNIKNKRIGPLLQGEFKAIHIETNEQLIHLSRYIHLNPLVAYLIKDLEEYHWSSYKEYIGLTKTNICSKNIILEQFKSPQDYKQFVLDQEDYGKKLEMIKHQLMDNPQV